MGPIVFTHKVSAIGFILFMAATIVVCGIIPCVIGSAL